MELHQLVKLKPSCRVRTAYEVRAALDIEPAARPLYPDGVALSLSTLADQVGAFAVALKPLHGYVTTAPVLAKRKTTSGSTQRL